MSLTHHFSKATRILHRFPSDRREVLEAVCRQIQDAERSLNMSAALRLKGCLEECQGRCCRNLDLEAVFGLPDFVYILALEPAMAAGMTECLRHEDPLFTSNCPFLEGGAGPCIFPPDVRPEVCVTSFCRGDAALRAEIGRVKKNFWKLGAFLTFRRVPFIHRMLAKSG